MVTGRLKTGFKKGGDDDDVIISNFCWKSGTSEFLVS